LGPGIALQAGVNGSDGARDRLAPLSFAPSGLAHVRFLPAAYAAGFILAPLRGFFAEALLHFLLALEFLEVNGCGGRPPYTLLRTSAALAPTFIVFNLAWIGR